MADQDNPGQFGENREDTEEQASKGGQMSSGNQDSGGQFKKGSARAKKLGEKGGEHSGMNR